MVFIASFDSFRQRLTMAALYSQMEINGAALSNIYANSGPGGLANAVNDGLGWISSTTPAQIRRRWEP